MRWQTSIRNQLHALAMGEETCRKKKLWSERGRRELEALALGGWAGRRRKDLLGMLDGLAPAIAELDRAVKQQAEQRPEAVVLMQQPGVGPVTSLAYPVLLTSSDFFIEIKRQRVPAQWNSLDLSFSTIHSAVVLKGARHLNAAKMVALYLASTEGHKLMLEEAAEGSSFYPANIEQEIVQEDSRRGLKVYNPTAWPGALDSYFPPRALRRSRRSDEF